MNIVLCGLPAAGKTSTGLALANMLQKNFIDSDKLMNDELRTQSCRQIFQQYGETFFRQLEHKVLTALKDVTGSVIAVGGGAPFYFDNIHLIKNLGKLLFLDVDIDTLWHRNLDRGLPTYLVGGKAEFEQLMIFRRNFLLQHADKVFVTGGLSPAEMVTLISCEV